MLAGGAILTWLLLGFGIATFAVGGVQVRHRSLNCIPLMVGSALMILFIGVGGALHNFTSFLWLLAVGTNGDERVTALSAALSRSLNFLTLGSLLLAAAAAASFVSIMTWSGRKART